MSNKRLRALCCQDYTRFAIVLIHANCVGKTIDAFSILLDVPSRGKCVCDHMSYVFDQPPMRPVVT